MRSCSILAKCFDMRNRRKLDIDSSCSLE